MCPKCQNLVPDEADLEDNYAGRATLWTQFFTFLALEFPGSSCPFARGFLLLRAAVENRLASDDPLLLTRKMKVLWTFLIRRGGPLTMYMTHQFLA